MKSVIIGASAGLGRALASRLAAIGSDLFLVASDARDLEALAADLSVRHGVRVGCLAQDLATPDIGTLVKNAAIEFLGSADNILLVAGISSLKDAGALAQEDLQTILNVNFLAPVRIANEFLPMVADNPKGNMAFMGSVATIRPRRRNSVYGAAKAGLEFYANTLRHHLAAKPCRVQCYRIGYLATQMTFGQKLPFPALQPDKAAEAIVANLGRDTGVVYLPRFWLAIAAILKALPWAIFKRLDI